MHATVLPLVRAILSQDLATDKEAQLLNDTGKYKQLLTTTSQQSPIFKIGIDVPK